MKKKARRRVTREELMLVHRAVERDMEKIMSGKTKTYTLAQVKKMLKIK